VPAAYALIKRQKPPFFVVFASDARGVAFVTEQASQNATDAVVPIDLTFGRGPVGMFFDYLPWQRTFDVTKVAPGGEAARAGVRKGWKVGQRSSTTHTPSAH
jgi:hypothetical protein